MAINFPNTPTVDQEYTVGNTTWIWTGQTWDIQSASPPTVSQDTFRVISVAGQSSVIAEQPNDTLTLVAGSGIAITTDNAADSITITNTGGSGGGSSTLSGLSDVQIAGLLTGQVLKYNGTKWVNSTDLTGEGGSGGATFEAVNTSSTEKTLRLTSGGIEYDVGLAAGNNISLGLVGDVITVNSALPTLTQTATALTAGKVKVSLKEGATELSQFTLKPGNNISFQVVSGEIQVSASTGSSSGIFAVPVVINNTTASTSSTTGSLIVSGGAGVAGDLNIGGEVYSSNAVTSDNQLTNKKYVDSLSLAYSVVFGM